MNCFVILTTQRSGSTVLTRTLDKHPDIFCAGEIFNESKQNIHHAEWYFPNWKLTSGKGSKLNKILNYPNLKFNAVNHIKKFFRSDDSVKASGFKLMYSQVKNAPFIWRYLSSNNIKVIVLVRKSAFRMALSRYRMSATGKAHATEIIRAEPVTVPARSLLQQTLQLQGVNEKLLSLSANANRLVLYYEDFTDWANIMQKVTAFLEVPFADLPPVLKKVSADNWKEDIKNYEEIENIFIQNNAEQYLLCS